MKIKAKYQGAVIRDPKIGRALEVNEKNLQTLIAYGHEYVVEFEQPKKKKANKVKEDKHEVKIRKKRSESDSNNANGETDAK